jgi:hypothetical protein
MGNTPPPNNVNRALFSTTGVKRDPPSLPKFAAAAHVAAAHTNIGDGTNDGPKKKKVRVAAGTSSKGGIHPQMGDGTDDKDADYLPITNAAQNKEVDGWTAWLVMSASCRGFFSSKTTDTTTCRRHVADTTQTMSAT